MALETHLSSILAWGSALLTGLFAVLGVWISNRSSLRQLEVRLQHEADRDAREALRQRLEELYALVGRWSNELVTHPLLAVLESHGWGADLQPSTEGVQNFV